MSKVFIFMTLHNGTDINIKGKKFAAATETANMLEVYTKTIPNGAS